MAFGPVLMRGLQRIASGNFGRVPLRHPPHRQHILFQRQRFYRTLLPLRQLEHRVSAATENVDIPFVDVSKHVLPTTTSQESPREETKNDPDWHAEVELIPAEPIQPVIELAELHENEDSHATTSKTRSDLNKDSDNASKIDDGESRSAQIVSEDNKTKTRGATVDDIRVREEARAISRLKRKIRRIEAGTYKPSDLLLNDDDQSNHPVTQLSAVLQKVESMPGSDLGSSKENNVEGIPKTKRTKLNTKPKEPKHTSSIKAEESKHKSPRKSEPAASPGQPRKFGGLQFKDQHKSSKLAILKPKKEVWQTQKAALERKFGEQSWQPSKRLSPDTLEGIRALHASNPESYTTEVIAQHFKISPEAIRRVLKSRWRPNDDEIEDRRKRWEKRGVKKWQEMADEGIRPPSRWRALGVKSAEKTPEGRPTWSRKRTDTPLGEEDGSARNSYVPRRENGVRENGSARGSYARRREQGGGEDSSAWSSYAPRRGNFDSKSSSARSPYAGENGSARSTYAQRRDGGGSQNGFPRSSYIRRREHGGRENGPARSSHPRERGSDGRENGSGRSSFVRRRSNEGFA